MRTNRKGSQRLLYLLEFGLIRFVSLLVSLLPRKTMVQLGRFLGGLSYRVWKERRKIALSNLDLTFGRTKTEAEKIWIAKEAFRNVGATLMEFGWGMRNLNEKTFSEIVQVEGLEILHSALSRGKGALILPAHYGNWEIMANACGYLNFNAHYVAKRLKNPYVDKMVNDYRCRTGNAVIYMNGASREMKEALKTGGVVATLLDQKVPLHRGGIVVKFFGHDAATTPLVAHLHLATSAPLIPIRCYPIEGGRCRLVFGPEVTFEPAGNPDEDVPRLTQLCMDAIESYIRKAPQFWIWGHKRWKMDRRRLKCTYSGIAGSVPPFA